MSTTSDRLPSTGQSRAIRRKALGDFLRSARGRLQPDMVGLPPGGRRRTPGLRREEIAQLCDISVTWYTWIEQGRDITVSPAVWSRLATVLSLSRAERHYLFELAETADPLHDQVDAQPLPAIVAESVHSITAPAYILDRNWNVLACNQAFLYVFQGWPDDGYPSGMPAGTPIEHTGSSAASDEPSFEHTEPLAEHTGPPADHDNQPNLMRYIFLDPAARELVVNWEERASRVVAEFRADAGLHTDEPGLNALLTDLLDNSPVFAHWWNRHTVVDREGGLRDFRHDADTVLTYQQLTFRLATRPDCKLIMLLDDDRDDGRAA